MSPAAVPSSTPPLTSKPGGGAVVRPCGCGRPGGGPYALHDSCRREQRKEQRRCENYLLVTERTHSNSRRSRLNEVALLLLHHATATDTVFKQLARLYEEALRRQSHRSAWTVTWTCRASSSDVRLGGGSALRSTATEAAPSNCSESLINNTNKTCTPPTSRKPSSDLVP